MTLPLSVILPEESGELSDEMTKIYGDIANSVNGKFESWLPIIEGSTTAGAGTYTIQRGYYYRQGIMVDCWFTITWTAHSGAGNFLVKLPFKIRNSYDYWPGIVIDSEITYPSGTKLALSGNNGTFHAALVACGAGIASASVVLDVAGSLTGHIRYIGSGDA